MNLSVFEPSTLSLREAVNRLMEDSFVRPERTSLTMPVDIFDTQEALVVYAFIPGAHKENLQIHYEKDILTLKAEVQLPNPPENGKVLLKERAQGTVSRTFRLPYAINTDMASAEFQDGVLTLTLPKQESVKPRTIKVN